jgi:hypothetical protein
VEVSDDDDPGGQPQVEAGAEAGTTAENAEGWTFEFSEEACCPTNNSFILFQVYLSN